MTDTHTLQLEGLSKEIFLKRYAYPGEETWQERSRVIARTIASVEKDEDKATYEDRFYDSLRKGDFIPGGRIIFGCGRSKQNMLNCYQLSPEDSIQSIGKTISDYYQISCGGGGVGGNYSWVRPRGDTVANIAHSAPGAVSVMKMINEIANHVKAGRYRRTALIAILNVDHPDLLEFLHVKLDKKELNNFNISVGITDKFLDAVDNDSDWNFKFNNRDYFIFAIDRISTNEDGHTRATDTINVIGLNEEDVLGRVRNHYLLKYDDDFTNVRKIQVKAKWLWDKIFQNSVECGDPGVFMIDKAAEWTNVSYFESMPATNPCGEIPLPQYGNCCLGHVNLANMVDESGKDVDWRKLARTIRVGIRFLDNVLTYNYYPIPECREVGERSRRIGLGVTGLHYLLIKLGYKYGDEKSIEFVDRLFMTFRNECYRASSYIAREKGSFTAFDAKKFLAQPFAKSLPPSIRLQVKEMGIRNAVMITAAPTGTISMLLGVSTGIEPIFAAMYKRRYRDANVWKSQVVVDPLFKKYIQSGNDLTNFVGAYDVTPEGHIRMQATIQRYVDNSLSKTLNLPKDAKWEEMSELVLAYSRYVKGFTIYRAGSKATDTEVEPLEAIPLTKENLDKYVPDIKNQEVTFAEVANGTACAIGDRDCGA
jgi:ribonucleoside-diphosphate reductase alpha chain